MRILQGYYLFVLLLFPVITPPCSMFWFQLTGFLVKIFVNLDSMCIPLSGGMLVLPQKHREASKVTYNSGFYITTNVYPNFGGGLDGKEIKKCLKVFEAKSLKHKDTSVTGKLRFFVMINQYISEVDLVHLQHVDKLFMTTINSWTLVVERFILNVAGVADPSLYILRESIYKR